MADAATATVRVNIEGIAEVISDLTCAMTVFAANFDGSREGFVLDGGDLDELRALEAAFGAHV